MVPCKERKKGECGEYYEPLNRNLRVDENAARLSERVCSFGFRVLVGGWYAGLHACF
jgi:hypothetical protein